MKMSKNSLSPSLSAEIQALVVGLPVTPDLCPANREFFYFIFMIFLGGNHRRPWESQEGSFNPGSFKKRLLRGPLCLSFFLCFSVSHSLCLSETVSDLCVSRPLTATCDTTD